MLESADLEKFDELEASMQDLLDDAVAHFSSLSPHEQATVMKVIRKLDRSWERLRTDVGESEVAVPEKSIRALLSCGCVMACMAVIQADDEISPAEREVLLHMTRRLEGPLSLGGLTPVSAETSAGTIEYYSHLVDTYDVMDYRVAGTLCAAIDTFRDSKIMAKFARSVTLLGKQISFVDGPHVDQRELAVLEEFELTMKRLTELINDANL